MSRSGVVYLTKKSCEKRNTITNSQKGHVTCHDGDLLPGHIALIRSSCVWSLLCTAVSISQTLPQCWSAGVNPRKKRNFRALGRPQGGLKPEAQRQGKHEEKRSGTSSPSPGHAPCFPSIIIIIRGSPRGRARVSWANGAGDNMAACGSIKIRKHRKSAHATIHRRIEKSYGVHASLAGIQSCIQSVQVACGLLLCTAVSSSQTLPQ